MKTYLILHHTAKLANNDTDHQFDSVNISHKNRWNGATLSKLGFYGGYHYLIERDGTVGQFRGEEEVGAHTVQKSMNYKAIGVSFAGNMSEQLLTNDQVVSAVDLIGEIKTRGGAKNITGHRDWKPTQCPGKTIPQDEWQYLLDRYEDIREDEGKHDLTEWQVESWKKATKKGVVTTESIPTEKVSKADLMVFFDRLELLD